MTADIPLWIAINFSGGAKAAAHLLKYDSVYGIFPHKIEAFEDYFLVDGKKWKVFTLFWKKTQVS